MNRPFRAVAIGVACCSVGVLTGGVVAYAVSGTPEIDRANATIQLQGNLRPITCTGEDATPYATWSGSLKGGESQVVPDPTDYPLSGPLAVTGIKWTINMTTKRGVLTGKITLSTATAATPVYVGKLTLVTQGVPAGGAAAVPARGFIVANFQVADDGVAPPNDDFLVANVEASLTPTGGAMQFGDGVASLGIPDFSVVTNVAPTAADGTC
jgi:hypothetical protein